MESLHFGLEQGWAKGLQIQFLNLKDSLKIDLNSCNVLKQVHSKTLVSWPAGDPSSAPVGDAWVASGEAFKKNRKALLIKTGDCMPLVYVDRQNECVIAMHAGWRGLQQGIHLLPFEQGLCNPAYTWIWLGPCLNGPSFEVGPDMWTQFGDRAANRQHFQLCPHDEKKRYFHAWTFVEDQFRNEGVDLFYNVEVDTFSDRSFVSWRRAQKAGATQLKVQNYTLVAFSK